MKYIWIIMLMIADIAWWVAAVRDIKTTLTMNKKVSDYNMSLQNLWDMWHGKKDIARVDFEFLSLQNLWDMWHGKKDISWVDFEFYTLTCVGTHLAVLFIISFVKWASQYVTIGL